MAELMQNENRHFELAENAQRRLAALADKDDVVKFVHIVTRIEKRFRSDFKAIPNRVNLKL